LRALRHCSATPPAVDVIQRVVGCLTAFEGPGTAPEPPHLAANAGVSCLFHRQRLPGVPHGPALRLPGCSSVFFFNVFIKT
jgi:hypothetical protein